MGPLGTPSHLDGLKKVAVVGGGVGCAIAYPTAKKLHELGAEVHSIIGFRRQDLVILEKEFEDVSSKGVKMSDDGTWEMCRRDRGTALPRSRSGAASVKPAPARWPSAPGVG